MPETTAAVLVGEAAKAGRGIAAFNVITLEHAEAVVRGAELASSGVIVQVSQNAVAYHDGALRPLTAAVLELARAAAVPVALHLDHVEDAALVRQAPGAGYSSVMVDCGRLPYEQNVAETAAHTAALHELGVFVEAELGYVGGKESQTTSAHAPGVRTDPEQAARFVAATGVDALAVAVGSSHAMTAQTAELDHDLIARLRATVPVPLVLHGSSGVPDDSLRRAVATGIVKVNIGTALNISFTDAVRYYLSDSHSVDPRRYLSEARSAMTATVRDLIEVVAGSS